jgi:hypothetical protein
MRLPEVSSKTAMTAGPMSVGGWVKCDAFLGQPFVLGLQVVDGELRHGDSVLEECVPVGLDCSVVCRLEEQLGSVGGVG